FPYFERGGPQDKPQIKCWRKSESGLDLVTSAGHEVRFPNRKVFPIRFILRHYPIRGQRHGERKVLHERKPRFDVAERAQGWHVQYDAAAEGHSFLRAPSALSVYDAEAVRVQLALHHRGVAALEALVHRVST